MCRLYGRWWWQSESEAVIWSSGPTTRSSQPPMTGKHSLSPRIYPRVTRDRCLSSRMAWLSAIEDSREREAVTPSTEGVRCCRVLAQARRRQEWKRPGSSLRELLHREAGWTDSSKSHEKGPDIQARIFALCYYDYYLRIRSVRNPFAGISSQRARPCCLLANNPPSFTTTM